MSDEIKKDTKKEPAEEIELSDQDLEQVDGGAGLPVTRPTTDKIKQTL
jgi:hypothetical protein